MEFWFKISGYFFKTLFFSNVLFLFYQVFEWETSLPSLQEGCIFFQEVYLACKVFVLEQQRFISFAKRPLIHLWANVHNPRSVAAKEPKVRKWGEMPLTAPAASDQNKVQIIPGEKFTISWQATIFGHCFSLQSCS